MKLLDYLTIIAIANLISEQTIVRSIVVKWFKPENYLGFSGTKKFIFDLLSCPACLSFHIGWLYPGILYGFSIDCIVNGLICMLIYDIILKLKR
jgi:hypothetical protein